MIEINGKVYRNLQEQVYENTLDIDELKAKYGYHGPYDSLDDIENPINLGLYLVGTELPYTLYEYNEITQNWTNLGPYNQRGPQGPQGPQGEQGEKGDTGDPVSITVNGNTYEAYMGNITIPDYPTSLDWNDIENKPTKVSDFTNDAGYITKSVNDLNNYYDKTTIDGIVEDIDEDIAVKANASDLEDYTKTEDLATVALTGDYDDLIDKPDLSIYAESADLAAVATTGSYNSLSDKPYIPDYEAGNGIDITNNVISFAAGAMESLQVVADDIWLATREGEALDYGIYIQKDAQTGKTVTDIAGDIASIKGKDATFVTCYSDNEADVTLQAIYSSGDVYKDAGIYMDTNSTYSSINLDADRVYANSKPIATTDQIPTKTSDLFNDSGYITGITGGMVTTALGYTPANDADLATVAKTGSYTNLSNTPDLSVYAETADLGDCAYLDEDELSIAYSQITGTPTNVSDFTNDAGYLTANDIPANIATTDTAQDMTATKTWKATGTDIKTEVNNAGVAVRNGTSNNVILDNDDLTFTYNNTQTVELERTTYKKDNITKVSPNNFTITQKDTLGNATTKTYTFDKSKEGTVAVTSDIPTAVSELTNDTGYITSSALSGYATETWVGNQGYITGINSTDVITALGYTPGTSNFSGSYTDLTNKPDLSIYAESADLATVATTGSYTDLTDKPTIPTVGNGTITIQKNGATVNTFTTNQSSNKTINITLSEYGLLDASGLALGQSWSGSNTFSHLTTSDLKATGSIMITDATTLAAPQLTVRDFSQALPVDYSITIPAKNGTLAMTSDITNVSGTNDGTNWTTLTIGNTTKNIPSGGGSSYTAGTGIDITNNVISVDNTVAMKTDIPTVPTNVSAFTNDAGYITSASVPSTATSTSTSTVTPTTTTLVFTYTDNTTETVTLMTGASVATTTTTTLS